VNNLKSQYVKEMSELEGNDDGASMARVIELKSLIVDEETKFSRYAKANARRRINYFPFVFNLLEILAKEGKLKGMTERATVKKAAKLVEAEKRVKDKADADKAAEVAKKEEESGGGADADGDGDVPMSES